MKKKIKCPCCGTLVYEGRFCSECGALLDGSKTAAFTEEARPADVVTVPEPIETDSAAEKKIPVPEDEGFSLLVDCCRRTVATVGGDGYDEVVLYKKDDTYRIYCFSRYEYMKETVHAAFDTTRECADAVFEAIRKEKLASYKDKRGEPLCGGENIVKFVIDGEVYKISEAKLPFRKQPSLGKVRKVLSSFIKEENKIDA